MAHNDSEWPTVNIIVSVKVNPNEFIKDKYIAGWIERALRVHNLANYELISQDTAKQKYGAVQIRQLVQVARKKPELSEVLAQLSANGS